MTIFITNDDGYQAKGINELIKALRPMGDIIVMAPDGPRSCMSGAFTSELPLHYTLVSKEEGLAIYACNGTPVDCVKLAMNTVLSSQKPDLMVAGINHGINAAICVQYSGTVAAAAEGCIHGIPSLATSLTDFNADADFDESCRLVRIVAEKIVEKGLPSDTFLNLNVPISKAVKGIKMCSQAPSKWEKEYVAGETPKKKTIYWSTGYLKNFAENENNDLNVLHEGYASLVPTKLDRTNYDLLKDAYWNNIENTEDSKTR